MTYFIVSFLTTLLSLLIVRRCVLRRQLSHKALENTLEEIVQLVTLGFWDIAEKDLLLLQEKNRGGLHADLLYARVLRGTKRLSAALTHIDALSVKQPQELAITLERARILLEQGNYQEALHALQQCIPILRCDEDILDLATALFRTNKVHEAWRYLNELLPSTCNGRIIALAADCQFHWKNFHDALHLYQNTQKGGWNNHQIIARVGYCHLHLGSIPEAKRCFVTILCHDTTDISAILGLGACFEYTNDYHKALVLYQNSSAWKYGHPFILRQAGICSTNLGLYDYAQIYLQETIKKGISSPQILAFLGYCFENKKDWESAERVYMHLVRRYPRHAAGYLALGWLYGVGLSTTVDAALGLSMAERAVELRPDAIAWELLSACEARAGNFERAHSIQEYLSMQAEDKSTRMRRRQAMRVLRKKIPLDENLVSRILVA